MKSLKVPIRYLPKGLSKQDKKKQIKMLMMSKKLYKQHKYSTRKKKGEGAYYSSGSRPNQTAKSWGLARLASSITSGKSAAVDYDIIEKGCKHNKNAFILANKSRKKYKFGHSKTKKIKFLSFF